MDWIYSDDQETTTDNTKGDEIETEVHNNNEGNERRNGVGNEGRNGVDCAEKGKLLLVSIALTTKNLSNSSERSCGAPPVWMRDYMSEESLFEDEEITANFVALSLNDSLCYNYVVKD